MVWVVPRKVALKTKQEREAEKQAVKTLYCAGQSLADAARAVGVTAESARQWAFKERWKDQVSQAQKLAARHSQSVTPQQNIAFDLAATNRQSRAALAQIANLAVMRKLKSVTEDDQHPGFAIFDAGDFASTVKATAQIAGDWENASASKFAVSLQLNQIVQSGGIIDAPEGVTIVEE